MQKTQVELVSEGCRREAIDYVRDQLPQLHTTHGLVHAIFGVSLHVMDDACPLAIDRELDRLEALVRAQCGWAKAENNKTEKKNRTALISHLHDVLFSQEGFNGSPQEQFYNPLNSYLPAVLRLKHGLPITLGIVYKAVAERVGLPVEGIFAPGHFLLRVQDEQGWLIVDPYHGGRVLTVQEACEMISIIIGEPLEASERYLPTATNKQWLRRVIVNLVQVFHATRRHHDLRAMHELLTLVDQQG